MDLSDLPQSAQDRIAAIEIEAESILKRSKIPAKVARIRAGIPWAKPEAWPDGPIQEQKRFEQSLFDAAAGDSLHQGSIQAARHLLGGAAGEYIRDGNLDTDQFDAKLEAIGDWVCRKFRVKRAWFDAEKQGWRVMALRKRAAAREAGETPKGTIIAKLPAEGGFPEANPTDAVEPSGDVSTAAKAGPAVNATNGNCTDQRAAINAFISKLAEAGRKITRKNIWTVAGYTNATEFERFQRGDTRTTQSAAAAFKRVLGMSPEAFIGLLDKKSAAK